LDLKSFVIEVCRRKMEKRWKVFQDETKNSWDLKLEEKLLGGRRIKKD
jgi:hypothetical protein